MSWAESPALTLGGEEELMILDAETLDPVPAVATLLADSEETELPGRLKTELFASVVELNTPVCETAHAAFETLRSLRVAAARIAERHGLRIAAAGTHPTAVPEEQPIVQEPRYLEFAAYAGVSARRQGVQGLHVHVGMPGPEECVRVLEGVLPWLPLFLALSANSPYLAGAATGHASNRAEVLAQLPRHGAPPVLRSFSDWEALTERMVRLGFVSDYTALWWDVRPHPRFGTIECRMPDQPTRIELSAAFVALFQALCATVLEDGPAGLNPADRALYEQARWAALHYGPRATLPHPDGRRALDVSALLADLRERVEPAARRLGTTDLLDALDASACEADRQLEIGRADGLRAVCADVVERTLG